VGSIAHSNGWCAVAVARETEIAALGIDVEATLALREELWEKTLTSDEQARIASLAAEQAWPAPWR
jgi:4'-phosphopantetheinyl transferase EntD